MKDAEQVSAADVAPVEVPTPTAPASAPASPSSVVPETPPKPAVVTDGAASAGDSAPLDLDRAGVAFDPARHVRRKHPKTGRWMPKGGRRPAAAGADPGAARSAPPAPSFIPSNIPPPAPDAGTGAASSTPEPAPTPAEPIADHSNEAAECAAQALQFAAGVAFDAHEDCACSPAEHRSMVQSFAAYIRAKGWQATAGAAMFLVLAAYLLRVLRKDKPREKVAAWITDLRAAGAKNVTPEDKRPGAAAPPPPPQPPPSGAPKAATVLPFQALRNAEFQ